MCFCCPHRCNRQRLTHPQLVVRPRHSATRTVRVGTPRPHFAERTRLFSQFILWLSRACLDEIIIVSINWRKNGISYLCGWSGRAPSLREHNRTSLPSAWSTQMKREYSLLALCWLSLAWLGKFSGFRPESQPQRFKICSLSFSGDARSRYSSDVTEQLPHGSVVDVGAGVGQARTLILIRRTGEEVDTPNLLPEGRRHPAHPKILMTVFRGGFCRNRFVPPVPGLL